MISLKQGRGKINLHELVRSKVDSTMNNTRSVWLILRNLLFILNARVHARGILSDNTITVTTALLWMKCFPFITVLLIQSYYLLNCW